jgi:type I restriction enzyme M protein
MIDRRHKELTDEEIKKISVTYHAWRGEGGKYEDVKGFCKAVKIDEIRKHEHILTPGRYVGAEDIEEDTEPFDEKMKRLTQELAEQFKESDKLEKEIKLNLGSLGWEIK